MGWGSALLRVGGGVSEVKVHVMGKKQTAPGQIEKFMEKRKLKNSAWGSPSSPQLKKTSS